MSIPKAINIWTAVSPVRFTRAPDANNANIETGSPNSNAPDPDDRCFIAGKRNFVPDGHCSGVLPVGLDTAVPQATRPETRVRLIREDMENTGTLYVTSSSAAHLDITSPAAGAALPGRKKMIIKFKVKKSGSCFLEVRFGTANGPIIHRLCVWINEVSDVDIVAHVPAINGTAQTDAAGNPVPARSTRTDAEIQNLINEANEIYLPYGLRFMLDPAIDRAGPAMNLTNRGFVNDQTNEFDTTTAHNRVNRAINMYFVPQIGTAAEIGQVGGSACSAKGNPNTFGSLIADMTSGGQTIAHELGHVLNLVNDPKPSPKFIHVNTREDPAIPGTGRDVRDDIISRRRLMWAYTNLLADPNMPYRTNVGYGASQPGSMLAIKQLDHERTDLEMLEVQKAADNL